MSILPGFEAIKKIAAPGLVHPVYEIVPADLLTPVAAFMKIAGGSNYNFLLESIEGGENIARYTFLGTDPYLVITCDSKGADLFRPAMNETERVDGNPIEILRSELDRYKSVPVKGLPRFTGGAVGYFAYDTIRLFENLPGNAPDPTRTPLAVFMFYDTFLVFDHLKHQVLIVSNVFIDDQRRLHVPFRAAHDRIEHLKSRLQSPLVHPAYKSIGELNVESNMDRKSFISCVESAKKYIKDGDIFQVVLSQRFRATPAPDPFLIYRCLRIINPSPYLFYLGIGGFQIIGSSPEMLVRVEEGNVETRPIAGTRPRSVDEEKDKELENELLASEKEKAEHLMLVDLGRNDIGRIAEAGSVTVPEFMIVEKYSHVMHLVSAVHGRLKSGVDAFDALISCFPAGTVSGAPKIRAMEIIDELEPHTRGIYAGTVGYFDFSGNLDSCIAIRTIIVKDGQAFLQVGAGIVADSIPESEYNETISKARGMLRALETAATGKVL